MSYTDSNNQMWGKRTQGMSDLLSPILHVVVEESEAFWCFAALMERMAPNFHRDQAGMQAQLSAVSKVSLYMLRNSFSQSP